MMGFRVLHVDDEPDIREVVQLALGLDPDLSVQSCGSGREGLETAAAWSPDLILLDVMMPVMDGPQTLAGLRQREETARIPVVFMTARAQPRELEHFVSLGAEGVIAKPFDPMTLAASVRNYAGGLASGLAQRRDGFIARARAGADRLRSHGAVLSDPDRAAAALDGIRTTAHSIAGGAGVFGLARLSSLAAALENAAIERIEGESPDIERSLDAVVEHIATI